MATTVQLMGEGRSIVPNRRLAFVLASVLGFAGCVSVPVDQPDDTRLSTWERQEEQVGNPLDSDPPTRSSLVDSLQRSARERAAVGQLDQAEELVLRALRIEPQASDLYLQLAELKTRQGDAAGAAAIARKGLTYSESGSRVAINLQQYLESDSVPSQ